MRNVTLHPETKPAPLIVKGCAEFDPVTGLGETLLIEGAATTFVTSAARTVRKIQIVFMAWLIITLKEMTRVHN